MSAGTCQICGCHGERCKLADGDLCSWFNPERTVCTADACIKEYGRREKKLEAEAERRTKKRAPWQVHELIKEERNAKRRAARAKRKQRGAA
jgi:hypothetical protein